MPPDLPSRHALRALTRDGWLLFGARCVRLFAYGFLSVVLVLYLSEAGLTEGQIGLLLTLTLLGDTAISLWITTRADRLGRRRMLFASALLAVLAGIVFALTGNFWLLLCAAVVGVISPSGNEVGPFLPIEQAALAQTMPDERRTAVYAWYNLAGYLATALGSLCGGVISQIMVDAGNTGADIYRPVVLGYACLGILLAAILSRLSPAVEVPIQALPEKMPASQLGLHQSRRIVLKLSCLFALDAFAGGFVMQSILAYWFHIRFDADAALLGSIFLTANLLAGISALAAGWLASRIGLVNTMVFTHLPSNLLLILVPLMPTLWLAVLVLLLRFSISQMDVPARQSYIMAVVSPEERSAAAGVTGIARSVGAAVSPMLALVLVGIPALMSVPLFLAGGIKIVYDLLLYWSCVSLKPPEEDGP